MTSNCVDMTVKNGVATICINREKAYNALNMQTMQELASIANHCGSDQSVRAAVLTGAGDKAFCAGGDIAAFADSDNLPVLLKEMTMYLHTAISRFSRMNAPLIGRINGVAAGAGLSLTACCDLAICTDQAKFTSAYTKIGLTPDGSSSYFLTRILGMRRTMELYLTNRTLNADEALQWGLVNQVVEPAALDDRVSELAEQTGARPNTGSRRCKKTGADSL